MTRNRLEAFSDGVIAILITIMVLGLTIPRGDQLDDLWRLRFVFTSYVLSFLYLAIFWNNHHHMLSVTGRVTGGVLWANMHLLFWLSLVVRYLLDGEARLRPRPHRGVRRGIADGNHRLFHPAAHDRPQPGGEVAARRGNRRDLKGKASPILDGIAIAMAFVQPWVAYGIYTLVALMWVIPDRRIERAVDEREAAERCTTRSKRRARRRWRRATKTDWAVPSSGFCAQTLDEPSFAA